MVDVLCVVPQYSYGNLKDIGPKCPNIGIATIAAFLEQNNYKVKILDAFALELTHEQVKDKIRSIRPSAVLTGSSTATHRNAMKILENTKDIDKSITTIYGGPHVTSSPETAITKDFVDYLVINEGEATALELLDYIMGRGSQKKEDIKGICYMENGKMQFTEKRPFIMNLDALPMPAYHLLPMYAYKAYGWLDVGRRFTTVVTSRGCPFKCSFCVSAKNNGNFWRQRSPEKVFEEIKLLYEKYNIRHIYFQDDEFCVNHKRVIDLCNMIVDSKMDLYWECLTRVNHVDEELIKNMARAGCKSILYGVEVGYEDGFKKIPKPITLEMVERAVRLTQKHKIMAKATFIFGFPWESEKELKQTIKFAKRLDADLTFFNTLTPYPGADLYKVMKNENLILSEEASGEHGTHADTLIRTRYLSQKQIEYWVGRAYLSMYLRPKYLLRKLHQMRNFNEFRSNIKGGFELLSLAAKKFIGS
ncbi:cobalamin B12-binding domain-containing protein [Candidatus Woesearchaeota archaeon]|nr:cobalamin B12-binding domain-containing protein [Candidatus Woesearchaeota archaeon]